MINNKINDKYPKCVQDKVSKIIIEELYFDQNLLWRSVFTWYMMELSADNNEITLFQI